MKNVKEQERRKEINRIQLINAIHIFDTALKVLWFGINGVMYMCPFILRVYFATISQ
jgi:hypothetical protein